MIVSRSFTHHGQRAQELGGCSTAGFSCCRSALAHWTLHSACPTGSNVGGDRSGAQIVPHFGPVLGLIGPVLAATIKWMDGSTLSVCSGSTPSLSFLTDCCSSHTSSRTVKVPIWASIVSPIVLGMIWPFWGVLVAPPLLAIISAYPSATTTFSGTRAREQRIGAVVGGA